jgi:hypothetical protein
MGATPMTPEDHKQILWSGLPTVVMLVVVTLLDHLSWWVPVAGLVLVYPLGLGFFWLRRARGRGRAG